MTGYQCSLDGGASRPARARRPTAVSPRAHARSRCAPSTRSATRPARDANVDGRHGRPASAGVHADPTTRRRPRPRICLDGQSRPACRSVQHRERPLARAPRLRDESRRRTTACTSSPSSRRLGRERFEPRPTVEGRHGVAAVADRHRNGQRAAHRHRQARNGHHHEPEQRDRVRRLAGHDADDECRVGSTCSASNFSITQSNASSGTPIVVPANGSVVVSAAPQAPQVLLTNLGSNQDVCKSKSFDLAFTYTAHS